MMLPDCEKRILTAYNDLKALLIVCALQVISSFDLFVI